MKKIIVLQALFFGTIFQVTAQETAKKAEELKEVTITKTKKAVEQRADRTIFDFANQPSLSSGSVLEGLKKLPGLISSDIAGMMYQGTSKPSSICFARMISSFVPSSVISPVMTTKEISSMLFISFTVLRRSSSALPLGDPIWVSLMNAKRKGFHWAVVCNPQQAIKQMTKRDFIFGDDGFESVSVS